MATVRYRNKKTGTVVHYAFAMPRLEKSDDWEREPENSKPYPSAPKKKTTRAKSTTARKKAADGDDSQGNTGADSGAGNETS